MWSNCQHCSKRDIVYLECKLTRKALKNFLLSVSMSDFNLCITGLKVSHTKMLHAELSANFLCGSSVFHFLLLSTNQNSIQSTVQNQHSGYLPWFRRLATLNTLRVYRLFTELKITHKFTRLPMFVKLLLNIEVT